MYLWVGEEVGLAAASEAAARAAARAAGDAPAPASSSSSLTTATGTTLRRASSASVRETYLQAGRRMGRMMCQYEPAYRGCDLVQVPSDTTPKEALAVGADHTSLAARFWRTLGEDVGTTSVAGVSGSRAVAVGGKPSTKPARRWSQEEDRGVVDYVDAMTDAQFDVEKLKL